MKKMKYTIPGQMLSIVNAHLVTAFIFFFIWLVTAGIWEGIAGKIFSVVGLICYSVGVYNAGVICAQTDKRTISPLTPHPAKGFLLPAILLVVNILVIVIYKLAWGIGGDGEYLVRGWAILLNMLCIFWTSAYENIIGMDKGILEIQGYLIICVLPFLVTGAGYYAGYKGYDIFEKIGSIAYENKKENKKN